MDYILYIIPQLFNGIQMTLAIFALTLLFALPVGFLLALGRMSKITPLRKALEFYVWLMRGTPLMLQLFFFYFALPHVGILLSDFAAAMVAFVCNYSAYFCEIYRSGIGAIPKGQYEAAHTLGMSYTQTMRRVILPQVVRIILPPLSNETITLVKDTSLVYVLAMNDLMRTTRNLVQRDFNIMPFIVAGAFYLLATLVLTILFNHLEKRYTKYVN